MGFFRRIEDYFQRPPANTITFAEAEEALRLKRLLQAIFEKGIAVLGDEEAFDKWLDTPNFFFDNKKPAGFLDTASGMQVVLDRLTAMERGDNV